MASTNSIKITSIKNLTTMKLIISNIILCTLISYLMLKADAYRPWDKKIVTEVFKEHRGRLMLLSDPNGYFNPIYPSQLEVGGLVASVNVAPMPPVFRLHVTVGLAGEFKKKLNEGFKEKELDVVADLMEQAYNESQKSNQKFVCLSDVSALANLDAVCGKALDTNPFPTPAGTSIIVQFKIPNKKTSTVGQTYIMVFTVAPWRLPEYKFDALLVETINNLLEAVESFSKQNKNSVHLLRMALVSGGRNGLDRDDHENKTAEAIFQGVVTFLITKKKFESALPIIQFPYKQFRHAWVKYVTEPNLESITEPTTETLNPKP